MAVMDTKVSVDYKCLFQGKMSEYVVALTVAGGELCAHIGRDGAPMYEVPAASPRYQRIIDAVRSNISFRAQHDAIKALYDEIAAS
jgi:hypothetical protein